MKFAQALYKKGEKLAIIEVEDIVNQDDFIDFIENLYCPEEGCNAKLVYNQKTVGSNYLSKHKSTEHDLNCDHHSDQTKNIRSSEFYVTQNGNLSLDGINRRKGNSLSKLEDYLNPPQLKDKKDSKTNVKPKPKVKTGGVEPGTVTTKIVYDPNSEYDRSKAGVEEKVMEPPFYFRRLDHISTKDANKNLETFGLIKKITIDKEKTRAKIILELENKGVNFILPPDFFSGGNRSVMQFQLLEFVEMIKHYLEQSKRGLYLTTMCQSHAIKEDDKVTLYVYDPNFMSFQLADGDRRIFKTLDSLIAAISTNAI